MKKTKKLATDVVRSIVRELPLLRGKKIDVEAIINSIPDNELVELEVYQFIEFMKEHVIGIKVAFNASDRGVAWELIGDLLKCLEAVGGINKKCNKHIVKVSQSYKNDFKGVFAYKGGLKDRKQKILDLARAFNHEMEDEREKREKEIRNKKRIKK